MSALETLERDIYWMRRALELARRGIGVSSPNPAVGCVILDRAGQVVGEGWHEYDLLDHAEVVALREAKQHALTRQGEDRLKGHGVHHAGTLQSYGTHGALHAGADCRGAGARSGGDDRSES